MNTLAAPIIREAKPDDLMQVTQFSLACAKESENLTLDRETVTAGVRAALADPLRARYFLAERDCRPVGQVMITREWSDWRNAWIWWLQSVYVLAEARGTGIFAALFAYVEARARASSAALVRLYVDTANAAAENAYLKAGFARDHYHLMAKPFD